MQLDERAKRILRGEEGEAARKALEVIVAVGEALDADRLVPVSSVHVSGISVHNVGPEGVELIEWFSAHGGRVRLEAQRATVNPMGYDLDAYIPRGSEWHLQSRLLDALRRMGFRLLLGCTPYEHGNRVKHGEIIAWSESNAVIYANSVLGARSNREGGIIALLAGLTGYIYRHGLHLDENRVPKTRVILEEDPRNDLEWGLVGFLVARLVDNVPLLEAGIPPQGESLKNMLAAAASWGSHALIHVKGVSPEYQWAQSRCQGCEVLRVTRSDLRRAYEEATGAVLDEADAVFMGCPHVSRETLVKIVEFARRCGGYRKTVYVAYPGGAEAPFDKRLLERLNIILLRGTCLVVSKLEALGVRVLATNSLKAAFYIPRRHGVRIALGSIEELLTEACRG